MTSEEIFSATLFGVAALVVIAFLATQWAPL
jgi:hypothetical protein